MKNIGFIGLGAMGFPIASNLLNAGYLLYVGFHRDKAPAELLAQKGAVICGTYKEVASHSDTLFTVVPADREVEEIIFGENGLREGLKKGSTIIDMSTIDLTRSREFALRLQEKGAYFLDAPISGGPKGAAARTLAIMVGGDKKVFDENRALLDVIGKTIVYCGSNGMGLAAKMANNLIVAAEMAAISEAMCLAVKAGIDPNELYSVLKGATANSFILNAKMPAYLANDYSPNFKLSLMCKDLNIVSDVAKKLGTPLFVTGIVEQIFNACKKEHGDKDSCAVGLFYQNLTGVSFESPKK
jgi:3-hydroxyisobutyrate dehydrogenase-like beta-hydroxyacid dehydrogenase